jgi:hypothetical protein
MINAPVTSVSATQSQIQIFDLYIDIPANSIFNDGTGVPSHFNLNQLSAGDQVEISGFMELNSGIFIAEKIQRQPFTTEASLQGPPDWVETVKQNLEKQGVKVHVIPASHVADEQQDTVLPVPQRPEPALPDLPPQAQADAPAILILPKIELPAEVHQPMPDVPDNIRPNVSLPVLELPVAAR